MDQWKELASIASRAGCLTTVQKAEGQVNKLLAQEKVKIVVTGMRGSGKTTLVNDMVGIQVLEPGNMDDEEMPLRVSFEPLPEDGRYRCIVAANHNWNEKEAILYELREEDILCDGELTDEMADKDVVLFLISATAPFNVSQVNLLKAMAPLYRLAVITDIEAIRESEREKVIQYIGKFTDSLSMPPAIIWDGKQDIGRVIRNAVPAYLEMEKLREVHCNAIFKNTAKKAKADIEAAIEANKQQMAQAGPGQEAEWEAKKEKSDWFSLRTDLQEKKNKAVKEATRRLKEEDLAISKRLMKEGEKQGFNDEWAKSIQQEAAAEFQKVVQARGDKLVNAFVKDIRKISGDAAFLKLAGYDAEAFKQLETDTIAEFAFGGKDGMYGSAVQVNVQADNSGSIKILLGTGAALGGCIIAPLPSVVCWISGAAVLGIGVSSYLKQRHMETASAIENSIRDNIRGALEQVEQYFLDAADSIYGKAESYLESCEKGVAAAKADMTPYQDKEQLLEQLLCELRKLTATEE